MKIFKKSLKIVKNLFKIKKSKNYQKDIKKIQLYYMKILFVLGLLYDVPGLIFVGLEVVVEGFHFFIGSDAGHASY